MKFRPELSFALSLFIVPLFAFVDAAIPFPSRRAQAASGSIVPGEFILEMAVTTSLGPKRGVVSVHEELYRNLRKRDVSYDVKYEYNDPTIFVGVSVKLSPTTDLADVARIPGVQAIRPVIRIPGPQRRDQFSVDDPKDARLPPDSFTPHVMSGVDKAHAAGFTGSGVTIAILDTGIDYNHPSLGGGIGPAFKVTGGFDLVGDAYNGTNEPVPDNDPLDRCNGHGTHVAGIIGANPGNKFGISGVAFGAKLRMYRVFGCAGTVTDDVLVDALLRAERDGASIISLSLGGSDGWTESSSSMVASRIARNGKVVVIAAGNDGQLGSWYSSSPGNGISVISVASVQNLVIPAQNATLKGVAHAPISYLQAAPLKIPGELPVYATSLDVTKTDDACAPLPADTPDLSNYLVLIHRGTCLILTKLENAAAKGARYFLIYNSDTGSLSALSTGKYQGASISAEDGKFLVGEVAKKSTFTISFPQLGGSTSIKASDGGLVSSFSSYGPTFDMNFKPAVAAPGGNILSTLPLALGAFGVESGTSMATPFIAGSAALLLQARGTANIRQTALAMRDLLQSTASVIPSSNRDGGLLQTASQQGAGLVQVFRAIESKTSVKPGQLNLNDTAFFNGRQRIEIKNGNPYTVKYKLRHVPAGSALSITRDAASPGPVPLTGQFATVRFQTSILLKPGETAGVDLHFTPPQGIDAARFPVYSGFITIQSAQESLKVTYLGVAATLKNKAVVDNSDAFFGLRLPVLLDVEGRQQVDEMTYSLIGDDAPAILFRLNFGSPTLQFHLLDKNTKVATTLTKRGWWSWWRDVYGGHGRNQGTSFKSLGLLHEIDFVPRSSDSPDPGNDGFNVFVLTPRFANKTIIPNGQYKILFRALRVTGNPKNDHDFESWESPAFEINTFRINGKNGNKGGVA